MPSDRARQRRRRVIAVVCCLGVAAAAAGVWLLMPSIEILGLTQAFSRQAVETYIADLGMWGVAASIFLMVVHSFVPFPAELVAVANGMVFGPLWGTVITWTGAMLGAYLAFGLARVLGRPLIARLLGPAHSAALDCWARREGGGALLFSRLIPVISFNLINYAAGLTAVSWWTFTWATGIGILPITVLSVLLGEALWRAEGELWIWLVLAAVAGWGLWHFALRRARPAACQGEN